jgi:N,N-dimethylformamidase beta subunit-like protein
MLDWRGSRRRLLVLAGGAGAAALGRVGAARGAFASPLLSAVRVASNGHPYAGDRTAFATIGGPGRDVARLHFTLNRAANITLEVLQSGQGALSEHPVSVAASALSTRQTMLPRGSHVLEWTPPANLPARTYILRLTGTSASGETASAKTVVRLLGVDAAFAQRSARPGDKVTLVAQTDAKSLSAQWLHSGPETEPNYANNVVKGIAMGAPLNVDWSRHSSAPAPIALHVGSDWPTGVYFVQVTANDGRIGYAPLIVRPPAPQARVAVVMPTTTWGAYNFYDSDGDGWGDTWYARWKTMRADLTRPNPNRGVPYRYRSYDVAFQHWLAQTGKRVDFYADEDIEGFSNPETLRAAYDLIVFPGHTEYVTTRLYDLIEGYRDRGGNLMFLSANNFFRRVDRSGHVVHLIDEWRDLGRPESGLLGVQYDAGDRGQRRAPYTVVGAGVAPWAFAGTGLGNGNTFGLYGIEADQPAEATPLGLQVLAVIPNLFGPARSAMMTYYEHSSGARVFSAGVLDFGGQALLWPQTAQLLANVWARLAPR